MREDRAGRVGQRDDGERREESKERECEQRRILM